LYIYGTDGLVAFYEKKSNNQNNMLYVHKDHLGSLECLTNSNGSIVQEFSYDAWGRRRNPVDWSYNNMPATYYIDHGYTLHEHLDAFGVINMNGRVYDPLIGRFLSPDNFVQAPDFTQSYNRYSYCVNNPLKYTDPNGEFFWSKVTGFWESAKALFKTVEHFGDDVLTMVDLNFGILL
jgi:RHS repeat-associated protein